MPNFIYVELPYTKSHVMMLNMYHTSRCIINPKGGSLALPGWRQAHRLVKGET